MGNATLYRNFPTRQDLIVAVCADEVDALVKFGAEVYESAEPAPALQQWLERFIEHIAANKGLASALIGGGNEVSTVIERCNAAINDTITTLLNRARRAGVIDYHIETADLASTAHALAVVAESDGIARAQRILGFVLAGTKPPHH